MKPENGETAERFGERVKLRRKNDKERRAEEMEVCVKWIR
jgi:hypothetical protein